MKVPPPPPKTSPLEDDDLVEEEAIKEKHIRENVFGLGGIQDHLLACLAHMMYCIIVKKQYNLSYFVAKRIGFTRATLKVNLSYGMLLTRLFCQVMEWYPHLDNGIYNIVDRVMRPLTLVQERKSRKDRKIKKGRHSTSSSSDFHHGSSSHKFDDDEEIQEEGLTALLSSVNLLAWVKILRKEKEEAQQNKFLENLKQLHINLLFIEALAQMPKYAKFLKGLLTNKARLEEACTITMNERFSTVLLNKLPSKEKDTGSFTIPCDIGQLHIDNALADLGASISLMPYTMYEKLGLGNPKATRMSLELADRSIQYPRGIIKNVLIKVDKFVLSIDSVILDMPEDSRVPIILGRPFLATARAMIDVFNKKITLRVGDDEVIFDVDQSIKRPPTEDDECYGIDDLDDTINVDAQELRANDEPHLFLSTGLEKSIDQSNLEDCKPIECNNNNDSNKPIRRISSINTPYLVSPIHVVPKKGGMTVVLNDDNELIPSRMVTGWRDSSKFQSLPEIKKRQHSPVLMAFNILKEKLTIAPIIIFPDWNMPFELMCDASDFAVGAVLGQRIDGKFKPIYYTSKTLNNAQEHYTTTKKELLAVVFSIDKFRPYLVLSKTIVYTDHSALKYLFNKQDAKLRLIRWVMLVQGFDIEIKDKRGAENLAQDHLSRLENPELSTFTEEEITDEFPN
ncbi:reverse transcriptase domain-containing protein [Tanacetum coccineum]